MINVIIADDHAIVRAGLKQILSECLDMEVTDEAVDGQDLLEKVRKKGCDVILLDISMPGRSGLEILKQLKVEKPRIPVLVLSMHPEEQYAIRTLKAGASGYLTKETASDKLIEAIRIVYNGGKYISQTLAEALADNITSDKEGPPHECLTDREYQVFCMIASGKAVSEIAKELFLSVKTISTYRRRILDKMNMKKNTELTYYAIENNIESL
ncbi:MAG: response regulator transcription factor [Spirochaetota bacterium]|nr:response regulator transcription factor [Spirochaetota bacterium]